MDKVTGAISDNYMKVIKELIAANDAGVEFKLADHHCFEVRISQEYLNEKLSKHEIEGVKDAKFEFDKETLIIQAKVKVLGIPIPSSVTIRPESVHGRILNYPWIWTR